MQNQPASSGTATAVTGAQVHGDQAASSGGENPYAMEGRHVHSTQRSLSSGEYMLSVPSSVADPPKASGAGSGYR
eukprot:746155-Hanusia_phi.AAC.1